MDNFFFSLFSISSGCGYFTFTKSGHKYSFCFSAPLCPTPKSDLVYLWSWVFWLQKDIAIPQLTSSELSRASSHLKWSRSLSSCLSTLSPLHSILPPHWTPYSISTLQNHHLSPPDPYPCWFLTWSTLPAPCQQATNIQPSCESQCEGSFFQEVCLDLLSGLGSPLPCSQRPLHFSCLPLPHLIIKAYLIISLLGPHPHILSSLRTEIHPLTHKKNPEECVSSPPFHIGSVYQGCTAFWLGIGFKLVLLRSPQGPPPQFHMFSQQRHGHPLLNFTLNPLLDIQQMGSVVGSSETIPLPSLWIWSHADPMTWATPPTDRLGLPSQPLGFQWTTLPWEEGLTQDHQSGSLPSQFRPWKPTHHLHAQTLQVGVRLSTPYSDIIKPLLLAYLFPSSLPVSTQASLCC